MVNRRIQYIGAGNVYDYSLNEENPEESFADIKPQELTTRLFTARLLNNVQGICQFYPSN